MKARKKSHACLLLSRSGEEPISVMSIVRNMMSGHPSPDAVMNSISMPCTRAMETTGTSHHKPGHMRTLLLHAVAAHHTHLQHVVKVRHSILCFLARFHDPCRAIW